MRRPRYVLCIGFIFNYLRYCSKDVNHDCGAGGRSEWLISASDLSGSGRGGDGSLCYSLSILLKYSLQIPLKFKPRNLLTAEKGVWVKFEKRVA